MNITERIAKRMEVAVKKVVTNPLAVAEIDVRLATDNKTGDKKLVVYYKIPGLSVENNKEAYAEIVSVITKMVTGMGYVTRTGPNKVTLIVRAPKPKLSLTAVRSELLSGLRRMRQISGETASSREAGDADLLHGSLKAAIKHASKSEKTDAQKTFLKAARAYLKEVK